ncbi:DUF6236 family protein [Tropicimonas sp. S265A]|uniref:DUF6236 family protein n=1 Tax=Tropicimonas sp. S265A TaxID=3415134 RepID=UPI003C7C8C08
MKSDQFSSTHGGRHIKQIASLYTNSFTALNQRDQGRWSLGVPTPIWMKPVSYGAGLAIDMQLVGALPLVTDIEDPYHWLRFRENRKDERQRILNELAEFKVSILRAENQKEAAAKAVASISTACHDLLRVTEEARFGYDWSTVSFRFDVEAGFTGAVRGFEMASEGLPGVGVAPEAAAILGGTIGLLRGGLKITGAPRSIRKLTSTAPFGSIIKLQYRERNLLDEIKPFTSNKFVAG